MLINVWILSSLIATEVESEQPAQQAVAASSIQESEKALEVKGSSRGFSPMNTKRNKLDEIDFVDAKKSYREEILNSNY